MYGLAFYINKKAYTLLFYTIPKVGQYIMSPAKWIKTAGTSTNMFAFHKFGLNVCVYTWFHSAAPVRFGPGGTNFYFLNFFFLTATHV